MAKLFHVEGSPAVYTDFYGGYRHVVNPAAYSKIEKDCATAKIPLHHFTITADQHAENLKAVA